MGDGEGCGSERKKKWLVRLASGSALIFNVSGWRSRALTPGTMHSVLLHFLLPVRTRHRKPLLTFALLPLGTPIRQVCDGKARSAN